MWPRAPKLMDRRARSFPGVPPLGVMLAVLAIAAVVTVVVVAPQTGSSTGLLDLRIYLGAARAARAGDSLYGYTAPAYGLGSTYPPLWTLLVLPLSTLDVHLVEYAWTFAAVVAWFAVIAVLARGVRSGGAVGSSGAQPSGAPSSGVTPWGEVVTVAAATLVSAPVWTTLNQGQVNILLWLLVVLDLRAVLERRRWAGACIGLAAAVKLTPFVAVVLLAGARRTRAAAVAATTATAVTLLAWFVLPGDSWRYWTGLVADTSRVGSLDDAQNNSLVALLDRLAPGPTTPLVVGLGALLGIAVLVVAIARLRVACDAGATIAAATVVGAAMALLSPISWTHHLVFLCFPVLLLVPSSPRPGRAWRAWVPFLVAIVLLIDPLGFGRNALTSSARTLVLLALLLLPITPNWPRTGDR